MLRRPTGWDRIIDDTELIRGPEAIGITYLKK